MPRALRLLPLTLVGVLTLATATSPVTAQTIEPAAAPPADYIALSSTYSQPLYPNTVREVEKFTTFDGEKIYLEIVRPDPAAHGDGPWPVILEASPYHGTLHQRTGTRIFPDPREGTTQIGLTGFFAPRGYAVAMMDLRGTGRSTGCLDHLGPKDARDMELVIEWLADRPWSNGRVGMTGHSYVGSTPSVAAAQRPRGLVTIVPSAGLASMYDHQYQKGVPYNLQWAGPMFAYEGLAMDRDLPPGFTDPVSGGATGDNFANGPNPQFGCGWQNSSLTAGSGQVTGQYELWHAQRDHRDGAADADIPVFIVHGVNDNAARIPGAEWFFGRRYLREGDKVWIGQWDHGSTNGRCGDTKNRRVSHPNCRFDQWKWALLAWFDRQLKQLDVDTGPAVEAFLNGVDPVDVGQIIDPERVNGKVYTADAWRRPDVRVALYPDATDGSLDLQPPAQNGSASFSATANAVAAQSSGRVTFTSAPVSQDTVFLGLPRFQLNASVAGSQVVHLVTTLYREDASGDREPMNFCAIQPMLRYGVGDVAPVIPLEEMPLPLQCFTMAHWVPAGHKLVLEVSTYSRHHASFGSHPQITVYTGPGKSEYLLPEVENPTLYEDVPLREAA